MKKLIFGLLAAATIGAALPAAAEPVVIREGPHRTVVVHPAGHVVVVRHHRHRVVWFDRHHHRHVEWR